VLLGLAVYAPLLGQLLRTSPLDASALAIAVIAATLPGVLVRLVVRRER
jgi:hypothetical protein